MTINHACFNNNKKKGNPSITNWKKLWYMHSKSAAYLDQRFRYFCTPKNSGGLPPNTCERKNKFHLWSLNLNVYSKTLSLKCQCVRKRKIGLGVPIPFRGCVYKKVENYRTAVSHISVTCPGLANVLGCRAKHSLHVFSLRHWSGTRGVGKHGEWSTGQPILKRKKMLIKE